MGNIRDKIAVIGMGCTKFGELWDKSIEDMIVEACREAFDDAGIEPKDVQAAWLGIAQSQYCGLTGQVLAHALKLEYLPVTRVENGCATGTDAFRNACYSVAAGVHDIVLVCGAEKSKDAGFGGAGNIKIFPDLANVEPTIPPASQFALSATKYFHKYGLTYEEGKTTLAKIAVKNHHNGTLSPKAHFQREVTIEQVMNAPMVSAPLGLFDCCGNSDGAAAAIIASPGMAKSLRSDYVMVKGLGLAVGARQGALQPHYDLDHFEETRRASRMAYEQAGINKPRQEIDMAMVHDCFTISELIIYEDLGFSPQGRAKEDIDAGTFALHGEVPVNTDGGLKCFGHPVGATGIRTIYEVYNQIRGKAGPRQLEKADIGLTHTQGGLPGSFSCGVCILGRED